MGLKVHPEGMGAGGPFRAYSRGVEGLSRGSEAHPEGSVAHLGPITEGPEAHSGTCMGLKGLSMGSVAHLGPVSKPRGFPADFCTQVFSTNDSDHRLF